MALPPIEALEEIDSTNAEARRRAEAGERGPLWITARRQTAGRGRRGRAWETGAGNLAATLLIHTDKPPAEAAQVSFVAALAVADLAGAYVPASLVSLKWPNDPMIAGKKAAGILVESGPHPAGGLWLAVGCGVNLATPPDAAERPATAFAKHMRIAPPSPLDALAVLAESFERWRDLWERLGFAPIAEAWTARAHGLGEACTARLPGETIAGVAEGLDQDGALRLRTASGVVRRITAGDVFFGGREMLLAIEQGNTNTLFAVHDGQAWIAQWRAATEASRTADEYAVWLSQLLTMAGLNLGQLDACIISSVVPQSLFNLRNLSRRYLHVEPLVVGENADLGIEVRILKPSEAGADRLVNAVGAHAAYPGDLLVIDSGTATTFDVIAGDGAFEGGVIAPGINLSMQALHEAAAQLPRVAIRRPTGNRVVGVDTVGAMQSGVFWGYIAMIEGLVSRIKAEWGRPLTVIGTGGVASLFEGATSAIDHFDHDLTIRGLLEIHRRNTHLAAG